MNQAGMRLRELLQRDEALVLPGVYDALTAKLAQAAGFEALVMGGYSIAASRLGEPDVGYLSMTEMTEALRVIARATPLPVIADGDTGYGNALSVHRTIQEYEHAGAAGVLFEDQVWPKRCGHMQGKQVIDAAEHASKIRAAVEGRQHPETLILARTDARAVLGLEAAIERGKRYLDAGAEALFIEAPQTVAELEAIGKAFPGIVLVANMIEGGKTPYLSPVALKQIGFSIVFWPCTLLYAAGKCFSQVLSALREQGSTAGVAEQLWSFEQFNQFIGLADYVQMEARYKVDGGEEK